MRIACLFDDKKYEQTRKLFNLKGDLTFHRVLLKDIDDWNNYDAFIHKITSLQTHPSYIGICEKINSLTIPVIDKLELMSPIVDRECMLRLLDECCVDTDFETPQYEIIREKVDISIPMPIICKPLVACCVNEAHLMSIWRKTPSGLDLPFLAQRFHPHDNIVFKCYVVGSKHFITARSSIEMDRSSHLDFNSNEMVKTEVECILTSEIRTSVDTLTDKIRKISRLTFFGFDFIRSKETGKLFVFDLNYFPSFNSGYTGFDVIDGIVNELMSRLMSVCQG